MHPAYSVIFFTTASGAGYGLLIWLSLLGAAGLVEPQRGLGLAGFALALGLVTAGLLSSTAHLGRPERAWRAFSQWRSSWLSREGVAAVATYVPAGIAGLGWVFLRSAGGPFAAALILAALGSVATLWCTGMIYASLKPIAAWNKPLVPWIYLALALATGGVLGCLLLAVFGGPVGTLAGATLLSLAGGLVLKLLYWRQIDTGPKGPDMTAATGLGDIGTVRPLDPPHTMDNFVMREMGYAVARRHAAKLRRFALGLLFLAPMGCLLVALALPGWPAILLAALASLSAAAGVWIERWLFFAEARHASAAYYRPTLA